MCQDPHRSYRERPELNPRADMPLPLCLNFFLALEGHQMEILSTWRKGAEGVGRGRRREGRRAVVGCSKLLASAGWGRDDFTPQKCLNQENNPTWDTAGKRAV